MRSKIRTVCWILLAVFFVLYCVAAIHLGKNTIITIAPAMITSVCALHLFVDWLYGDYLFYYFGHLIEKTEDINQTQIDDMKRELEEMKRKE